MSKIYFIHSDTTDPYYNLSREEFLLSRDYDSVMLWQNSKSVIIGYNQNALREVNLDFTKQNDIPVVRRLTGGGAVYHDLGNINFTFVRAHKGSMDFSEFVSPVCAYLEAIGIPARPSGRNDIEVNGFKVSGNAQTVRNGRILHHGTLLIGADMSVLSKALNPNPLKLAAKGVTSVRARVANLLDFAPGMTAETIINGLSDYLLRSMSAEHKNLSEDEIFEIEKLKNEKYKSYNWNIGAAPPYNITNSARFDFGTLQCYIQVERGIISSIRIYGDFFGTGDIDNLTERLLGIHYERLAVKNALIEANVGTYIHGCTADNLCELIINV